MKKRLISLCLVVAVITGLFALAPVSAASDMKTSDSGLDLIKQFEGFSGTPYRDTDGHYTIGYGTRCPTDMIEYYMQTPMTHEEAEAELRKEVLTYEKAVNSFIDRHGVTFTQQQFDAVVSLVYNVGPSWLTKGGTLINALAGGATGNELIYAFTIYSMSGGNRSVGHVKRRLAEANAYLNGEFSRDLPDNYAYVLYDGRGGTVSSYNVQGFDADLTAVPMVSASRDGYEFKGWYTAITGGQVVTLLDHSTKNITLYAQWEALSGEVVPDDKPVEPPVELPAPDEKELVVTVDANDVNVRRGPGLSYGVVAKANEGDKLVITDVVESDGYIWGQFDKGWIALEYTDYQQEGTCKHKYVVSAEKTPTCTEAGSVTYTCESCGDSYTETRGATGHDYAAATCTAAKKCKICGATSGSALGHNYSAATCTAAKKCKVCGAISGNALGHNYSAATCTAAKKCKTCGVTSGSALGHSYNKGICTRCGHVNGEKVTVTGTSVNVRSGPGTSYKVVTSAKKGDVIVITESRWEGGYLWGKFDKGWISLRYTTYDKESTDPCVHDYNVSSKTPATCTNKGSVTFTCSNCKDSYTDTAPAKGHDYGVNGLCVSCGAKNPNFKGMNVTVTANSVNLRSGAGLSYGTVGSVSTGAKLSITDVKQNDGYLWGKSSKGWIALKYTNYDKVIVDSCDHDYSITGKKDATCAAGGSVSYTCDYCGHSYTQTSATKPHTYNAATCTKPKTCKNCGATSGAALGHKYSEATCTAARKCATCGATSGSALGHKYGTDGLCSRCGGKNPNYKPNTTVTKLYATVINTDTLNIRKTPNGTIVGVLYKGDRVEILEQKTVSGKLWGRCSKGWIFIHSYGKLETVTETDTPATKPDTTPDTNKKVTVVKLYATVVNTNSLNIRVTPNGSICGTLKKGEKVEILEQTTLNGKLWGRCSKGWIFIETYGKMETVKTTVEASTLKGKTAVVNASGLKVRSGTGSQYAVVYVLPKDTTVVILEEKTVDGLVWAKINIGWVSARYLK
ncbi:MAG: SH3 domain-containing protein [Oscillospiraceae bacterium]|nr:SH3 domain-containing protein [Oscillospiraceae bacterium]